MPVIQIIFFSLLAVVAVATAVAMLVNRNAIYAALFLVLNFATMAVVYLTLGAPFIAVTQVTVYAGAIMVLFLFVVSMLGAEKLSGEEPLRGHRVMALVLALVFVAEVVLFTVYHNQVVGPLPALTEAFASPKNIGVALFTDYLLPFEVVGFILLSATIGAIVLSKADKKPAAEVSQGKE